MKARDDSRDSDDGRAHYDTVGAAFLGVSSTMVAIIASLFPFLKAQGSLGPLHTPLFAATIILLLFSTLASVVSLLERRHTRVKRLSCVVASFPLIAAILVLFAIVFL